MKRFELDVTINGQNPMKYMADLLKRNDAREIEIERGKLAVAGLKQMNNRSRMLLDVAKFHLKESEVKAFAAASGEGSAPES